MRSLFVAYFKMTDSLIMVENCNLCTIIIVPIRLFYL